MKYIEAAEVLAKQRLLIELTNGRKSKKYEALGKGIECLLQKAKEAGER